MDSRIEATFSAAAVCEDCAKALRFEEQNPALKPSVEKAKRHAELAVRGGHTHVEHEQHRETLFLVHEIERLREEREGHVAHIALLIAQYTAKADSVYAARDYLIGVSEESLLC